MLVEARRVARPTRPRGAGRQVPYPGPRDLPGARSMRRGLGRSTTYRDRLAPRRRRARSAKRSKRDRRSAGRRPTTNNSCSGLQSKRQVADPRRASRRCRAAPRVRLGMERQQPAQASSARGGSTAPAGDRPRAARRADLTVDRDDFPPAAAAAALGDGPDEPSRPSAHGAADRPAQERAHPSERASGAASVAATCGPAGGHGLQLAGERRRDTPADADVALAVVELDRAALADARQQLARRVRHRDVDVDPERSRAAPRSRRAACPCRSRSAPTRRPRPAIAGAAFRPSLRRRIETGRPC